MGMKTAGAGSAGTPGPFCGFHPDGFRFFRQLARHNEKPWFDRHRAVYQENVAGALQRLFHRLLPTMLALHPGFEASGRTGKNFSRINRDIRFARDKSPYRRNLYLFFAPRGNPPAPDVQAPLAFLSRDSSRVGPGLDTRLYVGLSGEGVTCGFAAYNGGQSSLARLLKPRRARHPEALEVAVRRLSRNYEMYWHGVERGVWRKAPGPPRTDRDWKRCRAWIVRKRFAAQQRELRSARFARIVEGIFRELFPLYAFAALPGRAAERAFLGSRVKGGRKR